MGRGGSGAVEALAVLQSSLGAMRHRGLRAVFTTWSIYASDASDSKQNAMTAIRRIVMHRCLMALTSWRATAHEAQQQQRRLKRGMAALSLEGRATRAVWTAWTVLGLTAACHPQRRNRAHAPR